MVESKHLQGMSVIATVLVLACSAGTPRPIEPALGQEPCAFCRMVVGDLHTAAQLQAPGAEPLFFDDLGCLLDHLAAAPPVPGAIAFVTDHRTGAWLPAAKAVYSHVPGLTTPMASSLVAHRDEVSRRADPAAAQGTLVDRVSLFGPSGPPRGER